MKKCSKCLVEKRATEFSKCSANKDGLQRWCKLCSSAEFKSWMNTGIGKEIVRRHNLSRWKTDEGRHKMRLLKKRWRQTKRGKDINLKLASAYIKRNKEKILCRRKLKSAIRSGELLREPCVICGNKESHGHHADYSKPLDVKWLCHLHHNQEHGKMLYEHH